MEEEQEGVFKGLWLTVNAREMIMETSRFSKYCQEEAICVAKCTCTQAGTHTYSKGRKTRGTKISLHVYLLSVATAISESGSKQHIPPGSPGEILVDPEAMALNLKDI